MSKLQKTIVGGAIIVLFGLVFALGNALLHPSALSRITGSVIQGSEYHATTTSTGRFASGPTTLTATTSAISGTLGSVVITGAAAGTIDFYDATTSNVNLRTGNTASSSILLASFPTSAVVGTYTLDETFYTGLLVSFGATMATSTITYRSN